MNHRLRIRPRLARLEDRDVPTTFQVAGFSETVVSGPISSGTTFEFTPEGRLLVLQQNGQAPLFDLGNLNPVSANFFAATPLPVHNTGERGLLGVAFDPNYNSNRFVYVYYTFNNNGNNPRNNRISRFTVNATGTGTVAGSETILMNLDNLSTATNHNGGAMKFGPDGKLYVAVGDNATASHAQSIANRHGKMLRLNPDPANPIPSDNPTSVAGIAGTTTGNNRAIYAAGLRNPYTFTFRPGTDEMFINDVGQNSWEEINVAVVGATVGRNFGWPGTEGYFNQASFPNFTQPFYAYPHPSIGGPVTGQATTGGAFYTAPIYIYPADYVGDYFFADYVSSWIKRYDFQTGTVQNLSTGNGNPVDLRVHTDGHLYYLSRGDGRVYRINYTGSIAPYIVLPPENQTASATQPVTFTVTAGGPGTLTYQWQRNNVNIGGATSPSYTFTATLADNGATYRVIVSNAHGSVTSSAATLTVTPNQPPVPTITAPTAGTTFNAGQTIAFGGSAADPEDGPLAASALSWRVSYFTNVVERPFVPDTPGIASGQFEIPTITPYTEPDVFYRIYLTATDSGGQSATVFRDIQPNTSAITLATVPAGLTLFLDGQPKTAPHTFTGVVGLQRPIVAPEGQTFNGLAYGFTAWSDGSPREFTLSTPAANTTLTASYVIRPPRPLPVQVNDGNPQRTSVGSLMLRFDATLTPVGAAAAAFQVKTSSGAPVPFSVGPFQIVNGRTEVLLTFTGPGLQNGSLPDGVYTLTVFGDQLRDSLDQLLDGDANGTPGGNAVIPFHRLFGDTDGDGQVNLTDFLVFRTAFGTSPGQPGYVAWLDSTGNGTIDFTDFLAFRARFGMTLLP